MMVLLLLVALAPVVPAGAAPSTWYVDVTTGSDENAGSAQSPFKTITAGLAAASGGDTVLVAPGTYRGEGVGVRSALVPMEAEVFPLRVMTGVTLRSTDGSSVTIIDGEMESGTSLIEVIEASNVTIEGFSLVNSQAFGGAGALVGGADSVEFRDVVFKDNYAYIGAGLAIIESSVDLYRCSFIGEPMGFGSDRGRIEPVEEPSFVANAYVGGGLYAAGSDVALHWSEFSGNSAYYTGAGALFERSAVEVHLTTVESGFIFGQIPDMNGIGLQDEYAPEPLDDSAGSWIDRGDVALQENGFEEAHGGGFFFVESVGHLTEVDFADNGAPFGGAIAADAYSDVSVTGGSFAENYAMLGSAITHGPVDFLRLEPAVFDDLGIPGVAAQENGLMLEPGLQVELSVFTGQHMADTVVEVQAGDTFSGQIVNCLFERNTAYRSIVDVDFTDIWNTTFADNEMAGVYIFDVSPATDYYGSATAMLDSASSIVNSVLWGNGQQDYYLDDIGLSPAILMPEGFADVVGGYVSYTNAEHAVYHHTLGDGNISEDPLFVSQVFSDYRLRPGSPSIDTGTNDGAPTADLLGVQRPFDGDFSGEAVTDMGAYEYSPEGAMRLGGGDRYATSVEISAQNFAFSDVVLIARGDAFADGLTASGLAGLHGAPLLLTRSTGLPAAVAAEIERLGASHAIIVGGPLAVGNGVKTQIEALGLSTERIGGSDRYETARLIADEIVDATGEPEVAFVVRGDRFPDALSVSPVAYSQNAPILLARPGEMPDPGIGITPPLMGAAVFIAGGEEAVSAEVEDAISAAGAHVTRIAGGNRYETSALFAEVAVEEGWARYDFVGMATGRDFPDALAGGAAIGSRGGVLMLTGPTTLDAEVLRVLSANRTAIFMVEVFGGPAALSNAVLNAIQAAVTTSG